MDAALVLLVHNIRYSLNQVQILEMRLRSQHNNGVKSRIGRTPMLIPMADVPRWYAERKPKDTIAISHGADTLTWEQLERNANRRARAFAAKGVKPGDFVAIGLPNSNAFFETTFAVWKCGATPTSLSWRLPRGEAAAVLDILKPSLVVGGQPDWNAPNSLPADFVPEGFSDEPLEQPGGALLEGDDQRRLDRTAEGDPRSPARGDRYRGRAGARHAARRLAAQSRPALSQRAVHRVAHRAVRTAGASPAWSSSTPRNACA